jgi:hypothetical protein
MTRALPAQVATVFIHGHRDMSITDRSPNQIDPPRSKKGF